MEEAMGKYVVIYSGLPSANADRGAVTAAWKRWFEGLGDAVLDAGNPFAAGKSVAEDGSVSEGGTHELTGYSILRADDLTAAAEMVKGCPGLVNATIDVYETIPFG
jgi:hypothetical protein